MARPEEVFKDEQDERDEDNFCNQLNSIMAQARKEKGLPKIKYPKTGKQLDAEQRRKKWKAAKSRFCEAADDEMFERDGETKELIELQMSMMHLR